MRKLCLLWIIAILLNFSNVKAQSVGVNDDGSVPHTSAMLDVKSGTKGMLIPRVALTATDVASPVSSPLASLLVYNTAIAGSGGTAVSPGFYYWNGSSWDRISSSSTALNGWSLNGNAGTTTSNFIGTTDAQPLLFRVNNLPAGLIDPISYNTAFGLNALASINNASNNTATGTDALYSNTGGYFNTANGKGALYSNTTGNYNTASGGEALYSNTTGYYNTANGLDALYSNTTGYANTANGAYALAANATGNHNTATGAYTLNNNVAGYDNTGNGFLALHYNSSGYYNTATGVEALYWNDAGYLNTANGYQALYSNNTGAYNTANGAYALHRNTTGNYNTANGINALLYNTAGSFNTAIGDFALFSTTSSNYNTAIGYNAGQLFNNGYNNVFVGANTDVNGNDYYNVIAIGQATVCTNSNQVTMGNPATNSYRAFAGWSNISDGRYKKNIKDNVPGLAFITKLRPVTYNLDATKLDNFLNKNKQNKKEENQEGAASIALHDKSLREKESMRYTGFVAQEVERTAREIGYDFGGIDAAKNENDIYGLRYADFVVPLVKAVQEQQTIIEKQNDELKKLKEQVEALTKAVQKLSSNK